MTRPWRVATLLLATMLVAAPFALAERGDDEDGREKRKLKEKREIEAVRDGEALRFNIERRDGAVESSVRLRFHPGEGGLRIDGEFRNGTEKSGIRLKIKVRELVEYADLDGDGAYDAGKDLLLASHAMRNFSWSVSEPVDATLAGKPARSITATGAFPAGNGTLAFVFYAAGDLLRVGGVPLGPDDVKFDVVIRDHAFSTPLSRLALLTKVHEKSEHRLRDADDGDDDADGGAGAAPGVVAEAPTAQAYFRWAPTATVDGKETPVIATVRHEKRLESSEEDATQRVRVATIVLNYAQGREIVHDPVVGVQSAAVGEARTPFAGLVPVLAGLAVVAVVARRRP